jgi:hypothetical protein
VSSEHVAHFVKNAQEAQLLSVLNAKTATHDQAEMKSAKPQVQM